MIDVRIDLASNESLWQIQNISVQFEDGHAADMGGMTGWQSYPSSVDEAKRWALLKIRHDGRSVSEEDIRWNITPPAPRAAA